MNARTLIAGLAAGLVALGAFLGIRYLFTSQEAPPAAPPPEPAPVVVAEAPPPPPEASEPAAEPEPEPEPEPAPPDLPIVLVAARAIPPGVQLARGLVEWREWAGTLDVDAALVKSLTPIESVLGTVARRRIPQGGLIEWNNLILPGRAGHMTSMLTPGNRAVTIKADSATTSANIIRPGDRVDVILVSTAGTVPDLAEFGPAAQVIAQDVLVLAVGSTTLATASFSLAQAQEQGFVERLTDQAPSGDTYTLEVAPEDAERVALASGMVTLAMRSFRESARGDLPPRLIGFADVLYGLDGLETEPEFEPESAPAPPPSVRIIRGPTAEVESLPTIPIPISSAAIVGTEETAR